VFLLLFALALFGSAWYIAFRFRKTFGLQRRWPLRVVVMAALVGCFMLMLPATKSAEVVAGLSYVLGGFLFAGYVFLTLAFVLLHIIERVWHIPKARAGSAALLLAAAATRKYLEKIVEETNQRKPDIVLITGDLIDSEAAFGPGERAAGSILGARLLRGRESREVRRCGTRVRIGEEVRRERPPKPGGRKPMDSSSWASTT
jgi:uncharacterized protein